MLTAIRKSDGKKVIGNQIPKNDNETYYCDYCDKEVIHNKSDARIRIGHFKHKVKSSDCPNNKGESELHLDTKISIYDYIDETEEYLNLELEKWICNKTIRPDVYCETSDGKKIAIEVQASALTIDTIYSRTHKYYKEGIYVLWVLPFEKRRFIYSDPFTKESWELRELHDRVKLKEYEIFLLHAYENQLIFWDYLEDICYAFIIIKMGQYKQADSQYWKDGEEYFHEGKVAKTIRSLGRKHYNVELSEFKLCDLNAVKVPGREYTIPNRLLMKY